MASLEREDLYTDITITSERIVNILNESIGKMKIVKEFSENSHDFDRYKQLFSEGELDVLAQCIQKNSTGHEYGIPSGEPGHFMSDETQTSPRIKIEDYELNHSQLSCYKIAEPLFQRTLDLLSQKHELYEYQKTDAEKFCSKKFQDTFMEQISILRDCFKKIFLEDLFYDKEKEKSQLHKSIWKKNEATLSEIEVLRPALVSLTDRINGDVGAKDEELKELLRKIEKVKLECQDQMRTICAESDLKIESERVAFESKKQILLNEIKVQEKNLQETLNNNLKREKELRTKRSMFENQLESLIGKYDADMGSRQEEFGQIKAEFDEEGLQLHILENNFSKQSTQYTLLMEEKAEEERMELERKIEDLRCRVAARIIQTRWRDLKRRRLERAKTRKGKKGKGKKKGEKNSPSPLRTESKTEQKSLASK